MNRKIASELLKIARLLTAKYKVEKWYYFRPPRGSMKQKRVWWKVGIKMDWSEAAEGRDETDYAEEEREMLLKMFKSDMQKMKKVGTKIGRPSVGSPWNEDYKLVLNAKIFVSVWGTGEEDAHEVLESLGYRSL